MNCHVFPCESWIWNRDECRYFQSKIERKRWYSFPTFRCLTQNTHPIEHICPAFKGDTLEDREHGLSEVVKAGDAPLGSFPLPATLRSIRAVEDASAWCWVLHHVTLKQNMRSESKSDIWAEYQLLLLPNEVNTHLRYFATSLRMKLSLIVKCLWF